MSVGFDVASESHTGTTGNTSSSSFTWNHGGGASARGALVFVFSALNSSHYVTSVTYGGVTMTEVPYSANAISGENGAVKAFYLDNCGTGTKAVVVNRTNNATIMYAVCYTVTAASATEVYNAGVVTQSGNTIATGATATPTSALVSPGLQAVNDGSPGTNSLRFSGLFYGGSSPITAGSGSTTGPAIDFGAYTINTVRETTAGQGSRNVGYVTSTGDDICRISLAVRETPPPPVTGTAASTWKFSEEATGTNTAPVISGTADSTFKFSEAATGSHTGSAPTGTAASTFKSSVAAEGRYAPPPYPTVVGYAEYGTGSSWGYSDNIPLPDGYAPGDVLVVAISLNSTDATLNTPSGWTLLQEHTAFTFTSKLVWRRATGNEGTYVTFTHDGHYAVGMSVALRNAGDPESNKRESNNYVTFDALSPSGGDVERAWIGMGFGVPNMGSTPAEITAMPWGTLYGSPSAYGIRGAYGSVNEKTATHAGGAVTGGPWANQIGYQIGVGYQNNNSLYANAVLALSPIAYWRFGEASGTTAVDETGHYNYPATYSPAPTLGAGGALIGDANTAATFNGSDDMMSSAVNLPVLTDLTFLAWVKTTTTAVQRVIALMGNDVVLRLYDDQVNFWNVLPSQDGYSADSPPSTNVNDGNWHLIALTRDGTNGYARLYLDGALLGSPTTIPTGTLAASAAYIGRYAWDTAEGFNGQIDEPAIWDRVLSPAEIAWLYAAAGYSVTVDITGTSASEWKFSETATGVETISGTADTTFKFSETATGNEKFTGTSAATFKFSESATGNEKFTGTGASTFKFSVTGSGSALSGVAATTFKFSASATGAQTISGTSAATFKYSTAATGAEVVSGSAASTFKHSVAGTGAETISGASAATFKFSESATGSSLQGTTGTGASTWAFSHEATGAVTPTGVATTTFKFSATAAGAETISGASASSFKFSETATGTNTAPVISGTSASTFKFSGSATGAETFAGAGASTWKFSPTATGLAQVTSGTAASTFGFSASATGDLAAQVITGESASEWTFSHEATGLLHPTGVGASAFKFSTEATGAEVIAGAGASEFKFSAAATGEEVITGTSASSWKFSEAASGLHAEQVTGVGASTFKFSEYGAGYEDVVFIGTAASGWKFAVAATGLEHPRGSAESTFKFGSAAAGWHDVVGTAASAFRFAADTIGLTAPAAEVIGESHLTVFKWSDEALKLTGAEGLMLQRPADTTWVTVT